MKLRAAAEEQGWLESSSAEGKRGGGSHPGTNYRESSPGRPTSAAGRAGHKQEGVQSKSPMRDLGVRDLGVREASGVGHGAEAHQSNRI